MVLIIGLGNPGKKYENTRHNVGHMVVDQLKKEELNNFILAKTDTFMNESGKFIKSYIRLNYPMVELKRMYDNLLVIHDDIDITLGEFKIQKGRGAAGHKGVQSIVNELGTKDFWRVRVGVCPKNLPAGRQGGKPKNVEKFVLQNFTKEEQKILKEAIKKVIQQIKLRLVDLDSLTSEVNNISI